MNIEKIVPERSDRLCPHRGTVGDKVTGCAHTEGLWELRGALLETEERERERESTHQS